MTVAAVTRGELLAIDAAFVREYLAAFTRTKAEAVMELPESERLTPGQVLMLDDRRAGDCFTEFSAIWNETAIMAPPPIYLTLRGGWEPS